MRMLRRRWWVVALVTACALAGTAVGLAAAGPRYEATATLQVPAATDTTSSAQRDDLDYTDRLTNTYVRIGESASLRAEALRQLPAGVDAEIRLEPQPNTELVELIARADRRNLAEQVADVFADTLVQRVRRRAEMARQAVRGRIEEQLKAAEERLSELRGLVASLPPRAQERRARVEQSIEVGELRYQTLAQQAAGLEAGAGAGAGVTVAERASASSVTGLGSAWQDLVLGLAVGLAAGLGVALLLERHSPQLDTLEDIAHASGATVLGTVPLVPSDGPPAVLNGASAGQQAFAALRAQLISGTGTLSHGMLMVTSPAKGDGKSLVAANLGASLARARMKTVLIDCDFSDPSVHEYFGLRNHRGLHDVLTEESLREAELWKGISHTAIRDLSVLTSGEASDGAGDLLASSRMTDILTLLRSAFQFVVIDSPDLATAGGAAALTARADAVVLVVGRAPVGDEVVRDARRRLDSIGAPSVSVVVNRWVSRPARAFGRFK